MNIDYQHLQAQNKASLQATQQNLQELHAENNYLRQQVLQLNNNLFVQRQQWSEEHFKLQEKIEELQNHIQGLLKEIEERQDIIRKLDRVNMQKTQQVITIRLLYNSVLQQFINNEAKKQSKAKRMNIVSIEDINNCFIKGKESKQDSIVSLIFGDLESKQSPQIEIVLYESSIQTSLHKLQAQLSQQSIVQSDPIAIIPQKHTFSLLEELKQIKTSQTIPNNMTNDEIKSSNTEFYFQYNNNSLQKRSLSIESESHNPLSQKTILFEPSQQAIRDQIPEEPCNLQQMMSFFLGGVWSGACLMWVIAN